MPLLLNNRLYFNHIKNYICYSKVQICQLNNYLPSNLFLFSFSSIKISFHTLLYICGTTLLRKIPQKITGSYGIWFCIFIAIPNCHSISLFQFIFPQQCTGIFQQIHQGLMISKILMFEFWYIKMILFNLTSLIGGNVQNLTQCSITFFVIFFPNLPVSIHYSFFFFSYLVGFSLLYCSYQWTFSVT